VIHTIVFLNEIMHTEKCAAMKVLFYKRLKLHFAEICMRKIICFGVKRLNKHLMYVLKFRKFL